MAYAEEGSYSINTKATGSKVSPRRVCQWCQQPLMMIPSTPQTGVVVCDRCDGPDPGWKMLWKLRGWEA